MKSSVPKPKKATVVPQPPPGVGVHDHVYFRHEGQPEHGRILAIGAHGCTLDHDGAHRQVKWEQLLGHRKRFRPQTNIVDHGEDGAIVQDENGKRVFVSGLGPADDMEKAIKGGAGLALQAGTDKAGHQIKRWKRTTPEEKKGREPGKGEDPKGAGGKKGAAEGYGTHNLQSGDGVSFKMGDVAGNGKVASTGEHGATVKDGSGRMHRVHWHEITDHKPAKDAQSDKSTGAAAQHAAPLYSAGDIEHLPKSASQPYESLEALYAQAPAALKEFQDTLSGVAEKLNLIVGKKASSLSEGDFNNDDGYLFIGSIKGEKRASEKAQADYVKPDGSPDYSQLRDILRATISVPSVGHVRAAIAAAKGAGLELAQKPKDRLATPTYEGYRDVLTVVRLPGGMLAELQFHLKPMTKAKSECHKDYEATRTLQGKYNSSEPGEGWSSEDHAKFFEHLKRQREVYGAAWEDSTKAKPKEAAKQTVEGDLQKCTIFGKVPIVLLKRKT